MPSQIMIIDDDPAMRQIISTILKIAGYEVNSHSSVAEAIEQMADQLPDLVCCDLMMHEQTGLDFLSICREAPSLQNMPVIIITAIGEEGMVEQARQLGAFACLAKPFGKNELLDMVKAGLARHLE